jgi:uncharacterized membrane protein
VGLILMAANALFWVVILVGAGFLLYAALRGWSPGPGAAPAGSTAAREDPLTLLAARYARGEIGREEFLQMRQDLSSLRGGDQA